MIQLWHGTCFDIINTWNIIILSLFKTHKATFCIRLLIMKMKLPKTEYHNIRFSCTDYQNALKSNTLITLILHLETCSKWKCKFKIPKFLNFLISRIGISQKFPLKRPNPIINITLSPLIYGCCFLCWINYHVCLVWRSEKIFLSLKTSLINSFDTYTKFVCKLNYWRSNFEH